MTKNQKKIKFLYQSLITLVVSFTIVAFAFKTIYFNRIFINLTLMFSSIITVMMVRLFVTESLKTKQENDFKYVAWSMSFIVLIHEIFIFWQYRQSGLGLLWNLVIIDVLFGFAAFHLIVVNLHNLVQVYVNWEIAFTTKNSIALIKFFINSLILFFINLVLIFNSKIRQLIRSWSSTHELTSAFKVILLTKYMKNQFSHPKWHPFLTKNIKGAYDNDR